MSGTKFGDSAAAAALAREPKLLTVLDILRDLDRELLPRPRLEFYFAAFLSQSRGNRHFGLDVGVLAFPWRIMFILASAQVELSISWP
mgnify:CR=1 FL=1